MPSIPWKHVLVIANLTVLLAVLLFGADWWVRYRIVQTVNQYHALIEPRLARLPGAVPTLPSGVVPPK